MPMPIHSASLSAGSSAPVSALETLVQGLLVKKLKSQQLLDCPGILSEASHCPWGAIQPFCLYLLLRLVSKTLSATAFASSLESHVGSGDQASYPCP